MLGKAGIAMQNFLKTEVTNYQYELTDYKKILEVYQLIKKN